MSEEPTGGPAVDPTQERHADHDRCIRDCCSGLRDGYAEAWTEAERRRD